MRYLSLIFLLLSFYIPHLKAASRKSYLGYVFPAGAQQGTTIEAIVGGQYLKNSTRVIISGTGVKASIIEIIPFNQQLLNEERKQTRDKIKKELRIRRSKVKEMDDSDPFIRATRPLREYEKKGSDLSRNFKKYSNLQLKIIANQINAYWRVNQKNKQLNERVLIQIKVTEDAEVGIRTIRLLSGNKLSNPIRFKVGNLEEFKEIEPNDLVLDNQATISTPAVMNGQIFPGDIDRYFFNAKKGDDLVIIAEARSLIPFLADAVSGWFQPTLSLYNHENEKIAFQDDFQLRPDPVLFYKIPQKGIYSVAIQDSIFRGRVDFTYRLTIGNLPYITSRFPLGFQKGRKAIMNVEGKNLPFDKIKISDSVTKIGPHQVRINDSNPVSFEVGTLPEYREREPNDAIHSAQKIRLPLVINGKIGTPNNIDYYSFSGKAGERVVVDLVAKELGSQLDSIVYLMDQTGKTLAWNDDIDQHSLGDITHHSDSYLNFILPADGIYFIKIIDAQALGGSTYSYRLRVSQPIPSFRVIITPSSSVLTQNEPKLVDALLIRKDGFDDEVQIFVGHEHIQLYGAIFKTKQSKIKFTLLPNQHVPIGVNLLKFKAKSLGKPRVVGRCETADNVMQAFLYRHFLLFPEMTTWIKKGLDHTIKFIDNDAAPIHLTKGKSLKVRRELVEKVNLKSLFIEVVHPQKGIVVSNVKITDKTYLDFTVTADTTLPTNLKGNLTLHLKRKFFRVKNKQKDKLEKTAKPGSEKSSNKGISSQKKMVIRSIGILPQIAFEVFGTKTNE